MKNNNEKEINWLWSTIAMLLLLTACAKSDIPSTAAAPDQVETADTTTFSSNAGSLALTLSRSFIPGGSSATATVKLHDSGNRPVANALITFTTDTRFGQLSPASGTTLTDASGVASIFLSSAGTAGAATLSAQANIAGKALTVSRNYAVGATTTSSGNTSTTSNLALTLSNAFVSHGAPISATATLRDSSGAGVPGVVVTFATDNAYGTLNPPLGTALTDDAGKASVTLAAAGPIAAGAATLSARAEIGGQTFEVARAYSVGATAISLSSPRFGVDALSAFGSTSVEVTASSAGIPLANQTITFTSRCASTGTAALSSSARTDSQGIATASYQDRGCAGTDTVTASFSGMATSTSLLPVQAPAAGSVQFLGASPSAITLRGAGGAGRQESAVVRFRVVDVANNPLGGRRVAFGLSTSVGGISLSSGEAISDAVSGEAQVTVSAGTVATPVRVTATTTGSGGASLTTQSDLLSISVGLPDQDSMSLSVGTFNIDGADYDGVLTGITVRLGDVFNNPVPDGTAVNFITEGGMIGELLDPQRPTGRCLTVNAECSVVLRSQNPRPADGRITIVAYAIGEESFTDANGNGRSDAGEFNNVGEVFRDDNFNGVKDAGEMFIDFNGNGVFDDASGDSAYNGSMCASACSAQRSLHVWRQTEVTFSGSGATILISPLDGTDLGGSAGVGKVLDFDIAVTDRNGNPMPAGSTVKVTASNGDLLLPGRTDDVEGERIVSFVVPNSASPTAGVFRVQLRNDGDATPNGSLNVWVTSPQNIVTPATLPIQN